MASFARLLLSPRSSCLRSAALARTYATSVPPPTPSTSTTLVHANVLARPSPQTLADSSVELGAEDDVRLDITQRAAEQLQTIAVKEHDPNLALRVAVESGGCHGYQYKMELTSAKEPDDFHFAHSTLAPSNIIIDAVSLSLLKGSTIDYVTELIGSSFRVVNNPQAKGNGCGCGVSWEAKF